MSDKDRAQVIEHETHIEVRGGGGNADNFTGFVPENRTAGGTWPRSVSDNPKDQT